LIVLDASAALHMLEPNEQAMAFALRMLDLGAESIHVPQHFKLELLSALRGFYFKGALTLGELQEACEDVRELMVETHPIEATVSRIVELTHNATPYDAAYVALAEALDCPLVTCDKRIADIPGIRAKVVIV
jgi:predicted nucleic acid-binding protein